MSHRHPPPPTLTKVAPAGAGGTPPEGTCYLTRDMWHQPIGSIAPAGLRPTHPLGALASKCPRHTQHRCPPHSEVLLLLQVINGGTTGLAVPGHSTTLGVAAGFVFGINILALEGGPRAFPITTTPKYAFYRRPTTGKMDERVEPEIQEENPAATGSQSTRRPLRRRGVGAQRRPTQAEILAGNVQSLTQTVQVLMEAFRESRNVPPPPRRRAPPVSSTRPLSLRLPDHPGRRADLGISRPRATDEATGYIARTLNGSPEMRKSRVGDDPDPRRIETVNVRGSTTSVFDWLGGIAIYRRLGRERSVDQPAKEEDHNQSRLDHLQRQLDQLVGQQYGIDPTGAVDPPFTSTIMAAPYPARFKMPSMASFDVVPKADPRVVQLFQTAGRRLCDGVPWVQPRKLGASHIFGIKQGETETLKKYLERFDKAIVQVEDCMDDTLIQAFREGVVDPHLVWTLVYDRPPTFAHLRGIAWRHAEADEYVNSRGLGAREQPRLPGRKSDRNHPDHGRQEKGKAVAVDNRAETHSGPKTPAGRFRQYTHLVTTIDHVLNQVSSRGLLRDPPPIRADRARRNQNKWPPKGVRGENITPAGQTNRASSAARQNPSPSDRPEEPEQKHIVHTIFGETATGDTASSRRSYVREARQYARGEYINMAEHVSKICRQSNTPITFTDDEADRLHHPHNDALVREIRVADNVIRRVLVDNGSSADIMFMDVFSRLKILGATLTPGRTPLYRFTGDYV
ncbi:hypothetical protein TIFTF001_038062 [Ficus carica]|uniref:Retrotransposon gag domain-containing protein n=1 Tax=Ficus carica TaxID=3494 RepID=A0AA88EHX8_FICCA|nr:hypothetical protein TIFTF001_038062 [Ficus carica]